MSGPVVPPQLAGTFLIAEADLSDPNFFRTVVYIVHHGADGAFGLVINREAEITVSAAIPAADIAGLGEQNVGIGGPVQPEYVFALTSGIPPQYRSEYAEEPSPGIVFEPSVSDVFTFLHSEDYVVPHPSARVRIVAGYSGWGAGQLEAEIEEGAWVYQPADVDIVFATDVRRRWTKALSAKSDFYSIVARTGYKPSLN